MSVGTEGQSVSAVSYSTASTKVDPFYAANQNTYKPPQYVDQVKRDGSYFEKQAVTDPEVLDSGNGDKYYDGSTGFKTERAQCNAYTTQPISCLSQDTCGWCRDSNSCVPGNNLGPFTPCSMNGYVFTTPDANWNPLASNNVSISRKNESGAQLTLVTQRQ